MTAIEVGLGWRELGEDFVVLRGRLWSEPMVK